MDPWPRLLGRETLEWSKFSRPCDVGGDSAGGVGEELGGPVGVGKYSLVIPDSLFVPAGPHGRETLVDP